ncbi:hypothetical protein L209DRAFT_322808 [Thermothelomyces heterothallicus CBS 203.75]
MRREGRYCLRVVRCLPIRSSFATLPRHLADDGHGCQQQQQHPFPPTACQRKTSRGFHTTCYLLGRSVPDEEATKPWEAASRISEAAATVVPPRRALSQVTLVLACWLPLPAPGLVARSDSARPPIADDGRGWNAANALCSPPIKPSFLFAKGCWIASSIPGDVGGWGRSCDAQMRKVQDLCNLEPGEVGELLSKLVRKAPSVGLLTALRQVANGGASVPLRKCVNPACYDSLDRSGPGSAEEKAGRDDGKPRPIVVLPFKIP